ncbi:MAG: ComF family protein [Bacteroidia bacterium]
MLHDIYSYLMPRNCACCHAGLRQHEQYICVPCLKELPHTNYHTFAENPLYQRLYNLTGVQLATAMLHFNKDTIVQELLHGIKYHDREEAGYWLGTWYGKHLRENNIVFDALIAVPMHPIKQLERGYNQSEIFALGLASTLQIPVLNNVLIKTSLTNSQTKKTKEERYLNLLDGFALQNEHLIANKHIALIDDVITTGATVEACCNVLNNVHNVQLSVVAIAVAEY